MSTLAPIKGEMLKPVLQKISELQQADLVTYGAWGDLADLSQNTKFEAIEAHPSGIYDMGNDQFEAVATVFLKLNFDNQKAFTNSFPAHVLGQVTPAGVQITDVRIDTSSLSSA
jgi:hypothetical protein